MTGQEKDMGHVVRLIWSISQDDITSLNHLSANSNIPENNSKELSNISDDISHKLTKIDELMASYKRFANKH